VKGQLAKPEIKEQQRKGRKEGEAARAEANK
jgi:hypothetical protein